MDHTLASSAIGVLAEVVTGLLQSAASFFMTPRGTVTKSGMLVLVVPSLLSLIRRPSGKRPMSNLMVLFVVSVHLAERVDGTV